VKREHLFKPGSGHTSCISVPAQMW